MKRSFLLIPCIFLAFIISANAGEIYTYTDKNGNTVLSNTPIPEEHQKKAKKVNSYKQDSPEAMERYEAARKAEEHRQEAKIRQKQQSNAEQASGKTGCEVLSFSQYKVASGGGIVVGGVVSGGMVHGGSVVGGETSCVQLTLKNNDASEKNINNAGIVAVTRKGNKRSPMGFRARIAPGGVYQGNACFGDLLSTITELTCNF